jgi:hypothetical protein
MVLENAVSRLFSSSEAISVLIFMQASTDSLVFDIIESIDLKMASFSRIL